MKKKNMNMNPKLTGEFTALADRVSIVLVGTLYPGNIGSVARSMHTFGFSELVLVSPACEMDEEARKLAVHSEDILDKCRICGDIGEALEGVDVIIGTTRRMGRRRSSYLAPPAMSEALVGLGSQKRVAILFGPEDTGLANEHIELCPWIVTIPTFSEFDSLNLSHAVTVILYEITRQFTDMDTGAPGDEKRLQGLMTHFEALLRNTKFLPVEGDPRRALLTVRRMIKRGKWSRSETDLFHSILNSIEKKMK